MTFNTGNGLLARAEVINTAHVFTFLVIKELISPFAFLYFYFLIAYRRVSIARSRTYMTDPELLFKICNNWAVLNWLLLIFAFRWKYTRPLIFSVSIVLLASLYTFLIVSTFGKTQGGFGSLEQVSNLFDNRWALLAGWVHYLAFDLLVGCWISADARRNGIAHLAVVPCLFFTFMLGPFGYLLYRTVRLYKRPAVLIDMDDPIYEKAS